MIGAAVYQWCEFKSHRGKNKNLTAQKSNSNTVWFNFQRYIYCIYISQIMLKLGKMTYKCKSYHFLTCTGLSSDWKYVCVVKYKLHKEYAKLRNNNKITLYTSNQNTDPWNEHLFFRRIWNIFGNISAISRCKISIEQEIKQGIMR